MTVSSTGGDLLTIAGPCFEPSTEITCTFGWFYTTTGVVSNMLRAYCPVPHMNIIGWVNLRVSINGVSYFSYLKTGWLQSSVSLIVLMPIIIIIIAIFACIIMTLKHLSLSLFLSSESLEELSRVTLTMPGILLHYDGDPLTLQWNPSDILPMEISHPSNYFVSLEVYAFNSESWSWFLYQTLEYYVENSGEFTVTSFPSAPPNFTDPIAIIAFRIVANDSETFPDFIRPIIQQKEVGIWSYIVYKPTQSNYTTQAPGLCEDWHIQNQNVFLWGFFLPCPCRTDQARMENSGFSEITSPFDIKLRQFLYPGADTCFQSSSG